MAKQATEDQTTLDDAIDQNLNDKIGGEIGGEIGGGDDLDRDAGAGGEDSVPPSSWRDQAKDYGLDLSDYEDDESAFRFLAQQAQQAQQAESLQGQLLQTKPLVDYGQEYLRHANDFQQWRQEQEAAQAKEANANPFSPPEYDPAWLGMVRYDENNVLIPDQTRGGTPEIVSKLQAHANWQRSFLADPYKHIESFVDQRAEERAKAIVEQQISSLSENFHAQQFLTNNREWLFERDPQGQQVIGQDGRPALSEEGRVFGKFLTQAAEDGLSSQQQQSVAMRMLDVWRQGQAQRSASGNGGKPASQQKKEDFLTRSAGFTEQVDQPTASTRRSGKNDEPPQNENQTLEEMMRAEFKAAGITDDDFARV